MKAPPNSKEIEEAVLGAILLDKNALEIVLDLLHADVFYNSSNKAIFSLMAGLSSAGQCVDLMTVTDALKTSKNAFIEPYEIVKMTNSVMSAAHVETHCRILLEKYIRRELIRISYETLGEAYDESSDTLELLSEVERKTISIGSIHAPSVSVDMGQLMIETAKKIEYFKTLNRHVTGITSGFRQVDAATRGWQNGDLIILAARPSVGKTAFALNLALNAAKSGTPVCVWSLEMKVVSQGLRMLSAESGIELTKLQTGKLNDQEMADMNRGAMSTLSQLPIYFDDTTALTLSKFRAGARRLVKKRGVKLLMIDYLQLLTFDGKATNREQEISKMSREIKSLAMELDVPIIALSQLSREIEKRSNPVPVLSDLRESGAIEQDADVVCFLYGHRDDEIEKDAELSKKRYVKVAKQRNGVLLTADLEFDGDTQKFTDPMFRADGWKRVELKENESLF